MDDSLSTLLHQSVTIDGVVLLSTNNEHRSGDTDGVAAVVSAATAAATVIATAVDLAPPGQPHPDHH